MAEALYLEYSPAVGTVKTMQDEVGQIQNSVGKIKKNMETLHEFWRGEGYQKRREEFESEFAPSMDKMVEAAGKFNEALDGCMKELDELDRMLAR